MVTNSFGTRNFMQPMWGLSIHSKCLKFFSFKFWVGLGEDFFSFFLCSQYVPFKFPMGSHQVPNMFSRFPMLCSPKVFPIAPHFNPICFAQSPPLLTHIGWAKGEGTPSFHRIIYFGETPCWLLVQFLILVWSDLSSNLCWYVTLGFEWCVQVLARYWFF